MSKERRPDPFQKSIANWRPADPTAGQGVTPEATVAHLREQALKQVRAEHQAAVDCFGERKSDLRTAHSIVIPEYRGKSAAVPFVLYDHSQDPAAVEYIPLVANEAQRDQFYFCVAQRREAGYKQTKEENASLFLRDGGKNRVVRNAVLEAMRQKRLVEQHSIMMSVRLDRKPQLSGQTIYLEYALHPKLRDAGLDAQVLDHFMRLYHDDLGYQVMAMTRDNLPADLQDVKNSLSTNWRLVDVGTFEPQKYPEEAEVMQRLGLTAIDVIIHQADESLA